MRGRTVAPLKLGGLAPTQPWGCGAGVAEYLSPSSLSESRRFSLCFSPLLRTRAMPGPNLLFVPGPTNVPERILRAMDRAMEDHRSSAFPEPAPVLPPDPRLDIKTTPGPACHFP